MVRDAQGVWVSRDHELGYKKLFARGAAPDLDALDARLDVIAGKLADWGDTDNLDVRRAKGVGRAMLSIHLAGAGLCGRYGVARVEDLGPILLDQVKDWLGHRNVVLKPVIDLNRPTRAADCYEVPVDIADAVHLRSPADCFPHATSTSRRRGDLDHTEPYKSPDEGGPPGQTRVDNLGRLSRLQHRIKTHGRWKVRQLRSGLWLWTSPHAYHYLVDHTGTIPLGKL